MCKVIVFTGKNLNAMFSLPCVKSVIKADDGVVVVLYPNMVSGNDTIVTEGDLIIREGGMWKVSKKTL